jgi:hypothetical protein
MFRPATILNSSLEAWGEVPLPGVAMLSGDSLNACKKLGTQDGCDIFGSTDEAHEAAWCSLDDVIAAAESTPSLKAALIEITPREVKQPSQSLGTFLKPYVERPAGLTDSEGKRRVYCIRKRQHPRLRTMQYLAEEIEQPSAAV